MQDVLIRNIPDDVLCKIDELSNLSGQSRVEYLRSLIKTHTQYQEVVAVEKNYQSLVKDCLASIQSNTRVLAEFMKQFEVEQ